MSTKFVPKFRTPYEGKERPRTLRTVGLRVHPEEVKRVDAFRSAFPEGSRIRELIEAALAKGKGGKPEGITDREYFEVLGRMLGGREVLDWNIVRRIESMPPQVQGDAYRVALERKGRDGSAYASEEFNKGLITDKTENVPGEKEEQVIQAVQRHIQKAQMEGKIMRAAHAIAADFEDWLENAGPETVNLLFYGQESVERILDASREMKDFVMVSASVREWIPEIARQAGQFDPERRLYVLRAFGEDLQKELGWCRERNLGAEQEAGRVGRLIGGIFWTYTYHGANLL